MTDAARSRYAPANPQSFSSRVGTVADALDQLVTIKAETFTESAVTLEARTQIALVASAATITLPSASSMYGNFIVVKNIGASGVVSVASTDLIEGHASVVVGDSESFSLFSTGTTWVVV